MLKQKSNVDLTLAYHKHQTSRQWWV